MATQANKGHDQGHIEGAVHAHVSSVFFYGAVFAALIVLTITTVAQSYLDLGRLNLAVVILIASMKASLVVTFFMHLRWDNKFNALIFISCLGFIGVFFAYTMNDTNERGDLDPDQNVHVLPKTGEAAPGYFDRLTPAHSGTESGEAPLAKPEEVKPVGGPAPQHH